jgi:lysozyme
MDDVTYILDASSFQGTVNWSVVDSAVRAGFEKATEGNGYANPFWPAAKTAMLQRAAADGFIPGCYLFADAESGAVQADWFAACAGDLTGFALAVDFERAAGGTPTLADAAAIVGRLRQLYPGHPIGLYAPKWFTGSEDLSFGDWLWASSYVNGTGSPGALYGVVPGQYWAAYGGQSPEVLQFTSSAIIPGVAGACDCSAYRGSLTQLRALLLPTPPVQVPTLQEDTDMADSLTIDLVPGQAEIFPVWAGAAPGEPAAYQYAALILAATAATQVTVTFAGGGHTDTQDITVPAGETVIVTPAKPLTWNEAGTVTLTRAAAVTGVTVQVPSVRAVLTRWK